MTGPQKVTTTITKGASGVHVSFTIGVQTFDVEPCIDPDDEEVGYLLEFIRQMLDKAFAKIQRDAVEWTNEQWQRRSSGDKSTSQYSKRIIKCLEKS